MSCFTRIGRNTAYALLGLSLLCAFLGLVVAFGTPDIAAHEAAFAKSFGTPTSGERIDSTLLLVFAALLLGVSIEISAKLSNQKANT